MSEEATRAMIESRGDFQNAVRGALAEAALVGCREIWLVDDDFAEWPLGEKAVVDDLTHWAAAHRSFTIVARSFDALARQARWVTWRRQFSHVVHCRANNELEAGQMPSILLVPGLLSVRLHDRVHYRGVATRDKADELQWREAIDAVLQRAAEAFPATTLGL
ncbi:hypothetical protein [Piscinibacter sp.]|uniref:hypothetical protein n=1 Tax=Piscinibacter sp. TaxID=1903157 RepID=UPI0039E67104